MAQTKNEFGWTLLATATASASSSIDFDSGIDFTAFDQYVLVGLYYVPTTDDTEVWLRVSDDGGSTYETTSYRWSVGKADGGGSQTVGSGNQSDVSIHLTGGDAGDQQGNGANEGSSFIVWIDNPDSGVYTTINWKGTLRESTSTNQVSFHGGGSWGSTNAVNGIRILPESSTIASGTFKLYGIN